MTKEQRDALLYQPKNGYDRLTQAEEQELNAYCEAYKSFLDRSKTERECVFTAIEDEKFYIFTHPESQVVAQPRVQRLASGINPET